jgi:hypothetical protein
MDVNYEAYDVALAAAATKANGHEQTNGFKLEDHHQMEIDDGYEHADKSTSFLLIIQVLLSIHLVSDYQIVVK